MRHYRCSNNWLRSRYALDLFHCSNPVFTRILNIILTLTRTLTPILQSNVLLIRPLLVCELKRFSDPFMHTPTPV